LSNFHFQKPRKLDNFLLSRIKELIEKLSDLSDLSDFISLFYSQKKNLNLIEVW